MQSIKEKSYSMFTLLTGTLAFIYEVFKGILRFFIPSSLKSKKSLDAQFAVVTGAGSGIGREIAFQLATEGCHVICWDLNQGANQETCQIIRDNRGRADAVTVDVGSHGSVLNAAQITKDITGTREVTLLINNAGIVIGKPFNDVTAEEVENIFRVNIMAHFWTTKAFLPGMIKMEEGHIVTVASIAGLLCATDRMVPYGTTKYAAVGFDESLRFELDFKGLNFIKTTCVCPFFITTGMFDGVRSLILPVLSPKKVAKDMINAIKLDEQLVVMPWYLWGFLIVRAFVPTKARLVFSKAMGFDQSMADFRGRAGTAQAEGGAEEAGAVGGIRKKTTKSKQGLRTVREERENLEVSEEEEEETQGRDEVDDSVRERGR